MTTKQAMAIRQARQQQRQEHWRRTFEWLHILRPVAQQRLLFQGGSAQLYIEGYTHNRVSYWYRRDDGRSFERVRAVQVGGSGLMWLNFEHGVLTLPFAGNGELYKRLNRYGDMQFVEPDAFDIRVSWLGKLYITPRTATV